MSKFGKLKLSNVYNMGDTISVCILNKGKCKKTKTKSINLRSGWTCSSFFNDNNACEITVSGNEALEYDQLTNVQYDIRLKDSRGTDCTCKQWDVSIKERYTNYYSETVDCSSPKTASLLPGATYTITATLHSNRK